MPTDTRPATAPDVGAFLPPVSADRGAALVLLGAEIATARHEFDARLARCPQPHRFRGAD